MGHHILDILQTLIQYSVAHEQWRALEVSLGILGNLACHGDLRQGLLAASPLAELVLERALWVDDTPALCEACRLLSGLCLSTKVRRQCSAAYRFRAIWPALMSASVASCAVAATAAVTVLLGPAVALWGT